MHFNNLYMMKYKIKINNQNKNSNNNSCMDLLKFINGMFQ